MNRTKLKRFLTWRLTLRLWWQCDVSAWMGTSRPTWQNWESRDIPYSLFNTPMRQFNGKWAFSAKCSETTWWIWRRVWTLVPLPIDSVGILTEFWISINECLGKCKAKNTNFWSSAFLRHLDRQWFLRDKKS